MIVGVEVVTSARVSAASRHPCSAALRSRCKVNEATAPSNRIRVPCGSPTAVASSGFRRVAWPAPSRSTVPPTAWATTAHSPFGSPGTYTDRPAAIDRIAIDLASDDLPCPITPDKTTFGLVSSPAPYSAQGSNPNRDPVNASGPIGTPMSHALAVRNGYAPARVAEDARCPGNRNRGPAA